jgi:hypothetical protein
MKLRTSFAQWHAFRTKSDKMRCTGQIASTKHSHNAMPTQLHAQLKARAAIVTMLKLTTRRKLIKLT